MRGSMIELVSVASFIGLAVVGAAVFGYVFATVTGTEVKAPEWLTMAVGTVVGFFFGKRNGSDKNNNGS